LDGHTETDLHLNTTQHLHRDAFGLRKLLIFVTHTGKVLALDTAHRGRVVWSRYLGDASKSMRVQGLFLVRENMVKFPPLIAVVTSRSNVQGETITTVHCMDALVGEDYPIHANDQKEAYTEYRGDISKVYRLPNTSSLERVHMLALLSDQHQASTLYQYHYMLTHMNRCLYGLISPRIMDN
jgi:hypothetical protein